MAPTDDDLRSLSREQLVSEVMRLRQGIRRHRDSTAHDLCWFHPQLWGSYPSEPTRYQTYPTGLSSCEDVSGTASL